MMNSPYVIKFGDLMLYEKRSRYQRIQKVRDHVKGKDYFGTLATILDLVDQVLDKQFEDFTVQHKDLKKQLSNIKKDLLYLQKTHAISEKSSPKK